MSKPLKRYFAGGFTSKIYLLTQFLDMGNNVEFQKGINVDKIEKVD